MKEIEIPLLTDEQIIALMSWELSTTELEQGSAITKAQRDLCREYLKKAGYKEKK